MPVNHIHKSCFIKFLTESVKSDHGVTWAYHMKNLDLARQIYTKASWNICETFPKILQKNELSCKAVHFYWVMWLTCYKCIIWLTFKHWYHKWMMRNKHPILHNSHIIWILQTTVVLVTQYFYLSRHVGFEIQRYNPRNICIMFKHFLTTLFSL